MRKIASLAIALIFCWLTVAQAQVSVDPYAQKDGTHVGHYRSNPDDHPHNNGSYRRNVSPYTGTQLPGDSNRYLERQQNRNNSGSNGQSPYQFNPYQIRW